VWRWHGTPPRPVGAGRDEKRRAWNLPAGAFDATGDYAFIRRRRIATIPRPSAMIAAVSGYLGSGLVCRTGTWGMT
jgi:hypothetical protein